MAKGFNQVFLVGYLQEAPQEVKTEKGLSIVKFDLVTEREFKGKDGEMRNFKDYHKVVAFGDLGSPLMALNYGEGAGLTVTGRMQTRSYEVKGVKKYMTEVIASNILTNCHGSKEIEMEYDGEINEADIPF